MARHGETRSPSPVGSSYSTSKRSRRDDDRNDKSRREDGRGHRRRSRSRSPDVSYRHELSLTALLGAYHRNTQRRYRDRESHRRRDRSIDRRSDRRDEDIYRPSRRERSRERRRSRDRDVGREHRRRSGDRDHRERRGDSRDQARRRRDDSTDSKRKSRREDTRDRRTPGINGVNVRLSIPSPQGIYTKTRRLQSQLALARAAQSEEEKKAEKLARVEAWKQKQAAERARKQRELEAAGGTRSLLDEIDKKATASPKSPTTATASGDASPVPYAGKFDPKAIAKKATTGSVGLTTLGKDVALPEIAKASATLSPSTTGLKADSSAAGLSSSTSKCSHSC